MRRRCAWWMPLRSADLMGKRVESSTIRNICPAVSNFQTRGFTVEHCFSGSETYHGCSSSDVRAIYSLVYYCRAEMLDGIMATLLT
uniref:Uncharacterized protein n=1 Tax=Setaria italica TaxID=4555 RepID=K3YX77_SETIT